MEQNAEFGETIDPSLIQPEEKPTKQIRWIIFITTVAVIAMLAMMLASVILGAKLTKEVQIGDHNELVTSRGTNLVKTSIALYTHPLSINTPVQVLEGVQSVDISITEDGVPAMYHLQITSFVLVPNRKLALYGMTHQIEVLADGSLTLKPLSSSIFSNKRRLEISQPILTGNSAAATVTSTRDAKKTVTSISIGTCADLISIQDPAGQYVLINDLFCTLTRPLFPGEPFTGTFDGGSYYLSLTIIVEGDAGLFDIFAGTLLNLNIYGNIQGTTYVGAFGAQIRGGIIRSCASYANITCAKSTNSLAASVAGGFFGIEQISEVITFQGCVSQCAVYGSIMGGGFIGASANFSSITFDSCLAIPLTIQAELIDAFVNPLNEALLQICTGENCVYNLTCQNSYFTDLFPCSYCSASAASNQMLTCPPVLINNGVTFHFTCSGNSTQSSSNSSASTNSTEVLYPVFPAPLPASQCIVPVVTPCFELCIFDYFCLNGRCVPGIPIRPCLFCLEGYQCVNNLCVPIFPRPCTISCKRGYHCFDQHCIPNLCLLPCRVGEICANGECVPELPICPACRTGYHCVNRVCVENIPIPDCPDLCRVGTRCVNGECVEESLPS